jgi:D-alanyl-D-alanine carboxypeptidase
LIFFAGLLVVSVAVAALAYQRWPSSSTAASPIAVVRSQHGGVLGEAVASTVWPAYGQAAFIKTGQSLVQAGPNQHAAPIASVAKVMTAYHVLRDHPLQLGQDGPTIRLTDAGVADTDRRAAQDESVVPIAVDQVRIVVRAMRQPVFARIVATRSVWLPVAGTVHNTDRLLGQNGFVGVKTGSDKAAGSCFAFRAIRSIRGTRTTITGVVLGQPGYDPVGAGLMAAAAMVDRITGQRVTPDPGSPPRRRVRPVGIDGGRASVHTDRREKP